MKFLEQHSSAVFAHFVYLKTVFGKKKKKNTAQPCGSKKKKKLFKVEIFQNSDV